MSDEPRVKKEPVSVQIERAMRRDDASIVAQVREVVSGFSLSLLTVSLTKHIGQLIARALLADDTIEEVTVHSIGQWRVELSVKWHGIHTPVRFEVPIP